MCLHTLTSGHQALQDEDESQEHLLECPGWREERGDLEVTTTKCKVMFFMRIMKKKK